MREESRCRHMGFSFRLAARVLLYAPSHRQDSTYHGLCYTSRRALAGTRNSSMGSLGRIDPTTHRTMSEHSYRGATSRSETDSIALAKELPQENPFCFTIQQYVLGLFRDVSKSGLKSHRPAPWATLSD